MTFQQYLIPQASKSTGVNNEQLNIDDDALNMLIKSYCRESGVRNLQKHIEKVFKWFKRISAGDLINGKCLWLDKVYKCSGVRWQTRLDFKCFQYQS